MDAQQIIKKYQKLKSERSTWESHWQEVASYTVPNKSDIIQSMIPGEKKGQQLVDSTAMQSNEMLAGALHGMLTNPTSIWFDLTTGEKALDEDDEVRKWLQQAAARINLVLNNSNFQTEIHEVYIDLGSIGTACLFTEEDDDTIVRFSSRHISEVYVEENNKGLIDTVFISYKWKLRQIAMEFGLDKLPKNLQEKYKQGDENDYELIDAIYPRDPLKSGNKKGPKNYPYASDTVLLKDKLKLSESGFKEFPAAVPRWTKKSGEKYGRSPGMKALPEAKMINSMMLAVIRAAQKSVAPPLQAPDDGYLGVIKTGPDAVNYYRSGTQERIEPIFRDIKIDFGYQVMEDVRKRIREAFYVDQLQLANGPQMTATEVNQRTEEKMRLMGPILGRQQSELLRPMIDRVFGIMMRKKKLPEPVPAKLSGKNISVQYSSMVAKVQRTSEGVNIQRTIQTVAPFVQTDPTVMDNFDGDKTVRYIASIYGLPQDLLRDQADVKKTRDQRVKQQQEAFKQQQEAHQAEQVQKVAPAAAKAKEAGII